MAPPRLSRALAKGLAKSKLETSRTTPSSICSARSQSRATTFTWCSADGWLLADRFDFRAGDRRFRRTDAERRGVDLALRIHLFADPAGYQPVPVRGLRSASGDLSV